MNNELYHYGVKGMKWGIRRNRNKTTNVNKTTSRKTNNKKAKYRINTDKIVAGNKFSDELILSGGLILVSDYLLAGTYFATLGKTYAVANLLGASLSRIERIEE